ncbi:GGDEF domain-containing protein [Oryzisolibacter propanilivorax]|nr:GGDEF domain-containing protein [Oryzisolibacter propanilivorax]
MTTLACPTCAARRSMCAWWNLWTWLLALALLPAGAMATAVQCNGAERIRLLEPVPIDLEELEALHALPPLRVTAVNAPPLASFDAGQNTYTGIAADVLCFISGQLGLRIEFVPAHELSVPQKIEQVQQGHIDVFMPLSHLPEREQLGLFSAPFYDSHYAVIARKGRRLDLKTTADLARLRVGVVEGVALVPLLRQIVPEGQLVTYRQSFARGGLFDALRDGAIDAAVFNGDFFSEQRYRHRLFDLHAVHTLYEHANGYRFYFSPTPQHQRVVAAFDRYLRVIDIAPSLQQHLDGERQLIERYVSQRSQRTLLQAASATAGLLALAAFAALRHHRRLLRQLADSHALMAQQQQALQTAHDELAQQSRTDGLTRLANRRHFDHVLAREHARALRSGEALSLLFVDLDHFKHVNDHYGHATGDDYLRAVARLLARHAGRSTDLAARYGGEEFVCLLPGTGAGDARDMAERIRAAVQELALPNALAPWPRLSVSIGVVTLQGGEHAAPELLAAADAQLYAAKHGGRNRLCATTLDVDEK